MGYHRYKFVIQSVVSEARGQASRVCSRCLWDTETDNFSSVSSRTVRWFYFSSSSARSRHSQLLTSSDLLLFFCLNATGKSFWRRPRVCLLL